MTTSSARAREGPEKPTWKTVLSYLERKLPKEQLDTWFRRAELTDAVPPTARIAVQNQFAKKWIESYYPDVLLEAIASTLGCEEFEIVVDESTRTKRPSRKRTGHEAPTKREANTDSNHAGAEERPRASVLESDVSLSAENRFESFVVGPSNRFAHAAALGVSASPGRSFNPLFIHAGVGMGKTHLLQSVCHELLSTQPGTRIQYLSCETFINHFISSLGDGDLSKFRHRYRTVDVLVIDDIHLLANKERTQEEFFHTFNSLYSAGKQIVLSSDSPPSDVPTLSNRLVSRFKWGMVVGIDEPSLETRRAIVRLKAKRLGEELPNEAEQFIAERVTTNIRELHGAVTRVLGFASLSGQKVDMKIVQSCLQDYAPLPPAEVSVERVLEVVTKHFGVSLPDLQSRKRVSAIAKPRQFAMFLIRELTRLSLEEIGGFLGGRDHSTVLFGVQKIQQLSENDPSCKETIDTLKRKLAESSKA